MRKSDINPGVTVTPGDVYDSVPYLEQLEHIHRNIVPMQAAAADSAYDFPLAYRVLEEQGIAFFVRPQSVHDRTNIEMKRGAFSYDADYREAPKKRQIWCAGTFAIQKRGHNLTRVLRRGLEAAEDHYLLSATALNLKRSLLTVGRSRLPTTCRLSDFCAYFAFLVGFAINF